MVENCEIIQRPKRICRGRGRGRGIGRGRGRGRRGRGVGDVFSLERCSSDDVLVEILARLPLKSIFRFKCVSKRWHQLISKDYFRAKIIERNKMDPGPIYLFKTPLNNYNHYYHYYGNRIRTYGRKTWSILAEVKSSVRNCSFPLPLPLPHLPGSNNIKFGKGVSDVINRGIGTVGDDEFRYFIPSSNGLLLCFVSHWNKSLLPLPWTCPCEDPHSRCRFFYQHVTRYYIYNPLTKLGYLLPYSPSQSRRQFNSHAKTESCPGIGRDCVALVVGSSSDDNYDDEGYKVVRLQASRSNDNIIELETFSSHTGEWRLSTVTVSVDTHKCFSFYSIYTWHTQVIKGAIYWMAGTCKLQYIIMCNDTKEEEEEHNPAVIEMIRVPCDDQIFSFDAAMGESVDGLLQLVELNYCYRRNSLKIWVYHPQDCRWFLRHRLPISSSLLSPRSSEFIPISFHPLNPNILLIYSSGWIHAFHLNTTPVLREPLIRFTDLTLATIHPYLPPAWPISPFPAAAQKK